MAKRKDLHVNFNKEDIKIKKEFIDIVRDRYGKLKGILGSEVAKAMSLYIDDYKGITCTPASPPTAPPISPKNTTRSPEIKKKTWKTGAMMDLVEKIDNGNK